MSIDTYFRPNIHQNGLEILGVNFLMLNIFMMTLMYYFEGGVGN
jgi:hypothetical protein